MNIFGIGGAELIIILVLALIIAGPKRMIGWAYVLGTYLAKMRSMWAETSKYLQQEFDNAGVDIQVPKDIPTRANITREFNRAISPITRPVQDALDEVDADVKNVRRLASPNAAAPRSEPAKTGAAAPATNGSTPPQPATQSAPPAAAPPVPPTNPDSSQSFGAWGGSGTTEG
ncbi:MAG: hypothetical protein H7175_06965 [Burkholderiales bacterium]|nr:hypothetical protein [Anaerolineae bacterium]